jgi:hypothetical protein
MNLSNISNYTEADFLALLTKICNSEYPTEKEQIEAVLLFEMLCEHPDGSDLIYYADSDDECTPKAIVQKIKEWRTANGKEGFKEDK